MNLTLIDAGRVSQIEGGDRVQWARQEARAPEVRADESWRTTVLVERP